MPSFGAMALIAAHWVGRWSGCFRTRRITGSRTACEMSPGFGLPIAPNRPQVGDSGELWAVQYAICPVRVWLCD